MSKLKSFIIVCSAILTPNALVEKVIEPKFCGNTTPTEAKDLSQITKTLYSIVSGEAGSKRDWQLMKQLLAPNSTITPVFHNPEGHTIKEFSVEEFIALNKKLFANVNFFETEVSSKIYKFGNTATIISQYESRDKIGAAPYSTGVNSFQLVNDGDRWCVISATWDSDKGPFPTEHFKL